MPEGRQRSRFGKQAASHHHQVARGHRQPVAAVYAGRRVLDAHQETVLHRVHIDLRRDGPAAAGFGRPHVPGNRPGHINTSPAEQLGAPGHIGILAVGEEIRVEEIASLGNVVDHPPPVERRGGTGAEDVFGPIEGRAVGLVPAAVEVPHGGGEIDTRGIDAPLRLGFETIADR